MPSPTDPSMDFSRLIGFDPWSGYSESIFFYPEKKTKQQREMGTEKTTPQMGGGFVWEIPGYFREIDRLVKYYFIGQIFTDGK